MSFSSDNRNLESEKWIAAFNEFEKDYKEAYYSIDKAIKLDEEGKPIEALPLYEFGLSLIDKALGLALHEPSKPDLSWEKAIAMMQKLRKTRKEIEIRIENVKLKPEPAIVAAAELPPSYEDVISSSKSGSFRTDNCNGNTFQLPGPSKADAPYIPLSAIQDQELLANLHYNEPTNSDGLITYSDLSQQLKEMKLAKNEEILFCCDNVQLYFIAPDGRVSSTSEPNRLIIARVHDKTCNILDEALLNIVSDLSREISEAKKKKHKHHYLHKKRHHYKEKKHGIERKDEALDQSKRTFLQVGSWIYPLIPEVSPCIRSEYGAFILPDINAGIEGAAVGLILPEEARGEVHELFAHLLNEISATGRSRRSVATDFSSDAYSSKIVRGAAYLAHNLVRGAGSTARFLDYSTPKIIDRINPSPEVKAINPTLQKTVEVAKSVTGKAVDVTDYLATKICLATSALGRYLSPHIQRHGTRFLVSAVNMSEEEASQKINSVLNVTSNAVEGISTLYNGLDTAASILARSLANNTVQIIEYKYGQPAGALTNDAITTFGNVYYTHHNFRVLKPKGIAKASIRGAVQALLEDYRNPATNLKPHQEFQGSGDFKNSVTNLKPHEEFQGSGPGGGSGFSAP